MSIGKASDFRVHDQSSYGDIAKGPADDSYITLSDDSIADDASIGDVLGTLSITAAYVGTPRWEIVGHSNFAVNATTGVVTVAHALTAGADSFKVKLRGTTPQINSPTFAITVDTGGVTNTAPHDITGEWLSYDEGNTGSGASATYQQDFFTAIAGGEPIYLISFGAPFGATDDEGDPITYTLTDDDNGLFDTGDGIGHIRLLADFPDTNQHSFTVRATDPGGLYVEQEFTITVTAANTAPHDTIMTWNPSQVRSQAAFAFANLSPVEIGTVSATDDEGNVLTYSLFYAGTPGSFSIESDTGKVYATRVLTPGNYAIDITATDPDSLFDTTQVALVVTA